MTKHDAQIKKLSTAMKRGAKICKENGIKQARGAIVRTNGNGDITCACAMGMAYIGKYGLKDAKKLIKPFLRTPTVILKVPKGGDPECFNKRLTIGYGGSMEGVRNKVMELNDNSKLPVDKIIQRLEACGL